MDPSTSDMIACPACGRANLRDSVRCFLCGVSLKSGPGDAGNPWGAPKATPTESARTYNLSTLMLIIALVAICLGVGVQVPGLGIFLLVVSVPALIWTLRVVARRIAAGRAVTGLDKVLVFIAAIGIVTGIGMAALIAFVLTCFPAGLVFGPSLNSEWGLWIAIAIGIISALGVTVLLVRAALRGGFR